MKEPLSDIIKLLESEGRNVSFSDVADSLWLYSIMRDSSVPITIKNRDENPENNIPKNDNDETALDDNIKDSKEKNIQKNTSPLYVDNEDKEDASVSKFSDTKIRIPTYKQYNRFNQFARVTKILREFTNSSSEREFDETLTVENIANTNIWDVSTHPKPELKYTLSLIIEKSESMEVWEELIHEFILAMSRFHFFKQVRVFYLKGDNKRYRVYKDKKCESKVSIKKFYSLEQRNLTILISDCISIGWGDKRGYKFLNKITKVTPFMILNMLPERMWNRTVLDNTWRVKFTHREGWKNNTLVTNLDEKRYKIKKRKLIRVPITTLEKVPLMYWSNIVAGKKNNWLDGSLFEAERFEKNIVKNFSKPIEIDAKEIVDSFYVYTSPLAQKLAIYFSVIPTLNMSIMKMIQQNSLPESNYTHLAEVFLSGLLKKDRVSKESKYKETLYTFRDGVAELLSDRLYTHKKEEIIENNSDFIENNLGYIVDFWARVGEEDKGYSLENSNDTHKFANIEIERENNNSLTIEDLKEIIAQGEGSKVDFKREWYKKEDLKGEFIKDFFSLANGDVFTINDTAYMIIGIEDRTKKIYDFDKSNINSLDRLKKELLQILNNYAQPSITDLKIEWYEIDNGDVLVISIPPQKNLIYLSKDIKLRYGTDRKGTTYYRIGESIHIASPDVIREFDKALNINVEVDTTLQCDEVMKYVVKVEYEETFGSASIIKLDNFPNNFFLFVPRYIFLRDSSASETDIDISKIFIEYKNNKFSPQNFIVLESKIVVLIISNSVSTTIQNLKPILLSRTKNHFKESVFAGYRSEKLICQKCIYSHALEDENLYQIESNRKYEISDVAGFAGSNLFIKEKNKYKIIGMIVEYEEGISAFNYVALAPYLEEITHKVALLEGKDSNSQEKSDNKIDINLPIHKVMEQIEAPFYFNVKKFEKNLFYKEFAFYFMQNFQDNLMVKILEIELNIIIQTSTRNLFHLINMGVGRGKHQNIEDENIYEMHIYDVFKLLNSNKKNNQLFFKSKLSSLPWVKNTLLKPDLIYDAKANINKNFKFDLIFIRETGSGTNSQPYMYHLVGLKQIQKDRYVIMTQFPIEKDKERSSLTEKISRLHRYVKCKEPIFRRDSISFPKDGININTLIEKFSDDTAHTKNNIKTIVSIKIGKPLPSKEYIDEVGIPFISTSDLKKNIEDIQILEIDKFTRINDKDIQSKLIQIDKECILFSSISHNQHKPTIFRPTDKIPYIYIAQDVYALICDKEKSPLIEYLYFQLYSKEFTEQTSRYLTGSTISRLNNKNLKKVLGLFIPLVSIEEQRKYVERQKAKIGFRNEKSDEDFDTLFKEFLEVYDKAINNKEDFHIYAQHCVLKSWSIVEVFAKKIIEINNDNISDNKKNNFNLVRELIKDNNPYINDIVIQDILKKLQIIRNRVAHNDLIIKEKTELEEIKKDLFYIKNFLKKSQESISKDIQNPKEIFYKDLNNVKRFLKLLLTMNLSNEKIVNLEDIVGDLTYLISICDFGFIDYILEKVNMIEYPNIFIEDDDKENITLLLNENPRKKLIREINKTSEFLISLYKHLSYEVDYLQKAKVLEYKEGSFNKEINKIMLSSNELINFIENLNMEELANSLSEILEENSVTDNVDNSLIYIEEALKYLKENQRNIVIDIVTKLEDNRPIYRDELEINKIEFLESLNSHFEWMIKLLYELDDKKVSTDSLSIIDSLHQAYCDFYQKFSLYIENIEQKEEVKRILKELSISISEKYKCA